jgi:hypothetical protein
MNIAMGLEDVEVKPHVKEIFTRFDALDIGAGEVALVHGGLASQNVTLDPETSEVLGIYGFEDIACVDRHRAFKHLPSYPALFQTPSRYCWRTYFNPKADVSARDVPGSSGFKEAVDGVKFTARRSSPTVSPPFFRYAYQLLFIPEFFAQHVCISYMEVLGISGLGGPESIARRYNRKAAWVGIMGLALIGGLAAAVQLGTGPRRCLASCDAGWRHTLCSTTIQNCKGPCSIPNSIALAWVRSRGHCSMP